MKKPNGGSMCTCGHRANEHAGLVGWCLGCQSGGSEMCAQFDIALVQDGRPVIVREKRASASPSPGHRCWDCRKPADTKRFSVRNQYGKPPRFGGQIRRWAFLCPVCVARLKAKGWHLKMDDDGRSKN